LHKSAAATRALSMQMQTRFHLEQMLAKGSAAIALRSNLGFAFL
jgi:hypothetical protein